MKTYILHPKGFKSKNPRVISVKEALLIMGFDDEFKFPDGLGVGNRYQMTVDSVSPIFSKVIAKVIKQLYKKEFS